MIARIIDIFSVIINIIYGIIAEANTITNHKTIPAILSFSAVLHFFLKKLSNFDIAFPINLIGCGKP